MAHPSPEPGLLETHNYKNISRNNHIKGRRQKNRMTREILLELHN